MNASGILAHLERRLPEFEASGRPEALVGGSLNQVWRVSGHPESVIVKVAPPYIAAKPDIPLDPGRSAIEARILRAFGVDGALEAIASPAVRPPRLLDFDEAAHVLVMEDVGLCPGLGTWLYQWPDPACWEGDLGSLLGGFIGRLHRLSAGDRCMAQAFDNQSIQRTRLEVQYAAIRGLCERAALPDADELGRRALALGELLQEPGLCVIMGDLWPPSVRVTAAGVRVIDWELAHYGRPCQDVGHLAAHLWMHAHRAPTAEVACQARGTLERFFTAYRDALGDQFGDLFGLAGVRESAIHFGAEVLVRTVGAFQAGYLYEGLGPGDPQVQEAVQVARAHIRSLEDASTFALLR